MAEMNDAGTKKAATTLLSNLFQQAEWPMSGHFLI
jgi:hypothetical protein